MDSRCNLYLHREAQAWNPKKKHLPVTLVTGFLGAGKTTLLTYILHNKHNLKIAAAVNDFASLNIDGQIVRGTGRHDEVVELSNGCLCCSVSGEFQKAVWQLLQDADIGKIDYLVVETSGVTDPLQTIATLEQDYGKMYRIRLDVVVTVVDTDTLVSKLAQDRETQSISMSVAADSQLRCADVVLLNKSDLVTDEQLLIAKQFISSCVPGVQIHPCTYCAIPLHLIMEVDEVQSSLQVVSHEVTPAAYTISPQGGTMNLERRKRQEVEKGKKKHDHVDHLLEDDFSSVVFVSSKPLCLEKFQSFLGLGFPQGVLRMKGCVWFAENRSCLYSFHMSGRCRYEVSQQASRSSDFQIGAFSVQLVAIGKGLDMAIVNEALEECVANENSEEETEERCKRYKYISDLVAKNEYFVLVESSNDCNKGSFVDFRLSGCIDYGVSEEEAAGFHGINFNRMNLELAKRVNGSSSCVSVLPVLLASGSIVCRHCVCRNANFEESWYLIQDIGDKVVAEFFRAVGVCKCGR